MGVAAEDDGTAEIARRSRGTPRIANRLLRRVRDFAQVKADGKITKPVAQEALRMLEVDPIGLDKMDTMLLVTLIDKFSGGPVGVETLAAAIGEEKDTIEDVYEPFLIQAGFLKRTPAAAWRSSWRTNISGATRQRQRVTVRRINLAFFEWVSLYPGADKKGEKLIYANGRVWQDAGLYWNRPGGSWVDLFGGWQDPWLGNLPGDITIQRERFTFYFPLTTCILISVIITLVLYF